MNQSMLDELKQFITTTVTQVVSKATAHLATKDDIPQVDHLATKVDLYGIRIDVRAVEHRLNRRLDTMQAAIVETITIVNDAHDAHFNEHERRLVALERLSALNP